MEGSEGSELGYPPSYSAAERSALRITRVHFITGHIVFLLSDGKSLCVPLSIAPDLATASFEDRYMWHLVGDGQGIVWHTRYAEVHLSLHALLVHPGATIIELPAPSN